jgi:hypothetical protein
LFGAGTVIAVFMAEIEATLRGRPTLTDDDVTDLIEAIVDELDEHAIDPEVRTRRDGRDVHITVGVAVDSDDEMEAMSAGFDAIKAAFAVAGVGPARATVPHDLRSRVLPVQAA